MFNAASPAYIHLQKIGLFFTKEIVQLLLFSVVCFLHVTNEKQYSVCVAVHVLWLL